VRVNAAGFFELEVPATGKVALRVALARDLRGSSAPTGQRGRMPHGFIEARKLRLDPYDVTFVSVFEAACASTAFADECFNEHDCEPLEHSRSPGERLERLPRSIGSCLQSRTTAGGTRGQGSRIRASTLPTVIAHDRDFAPTPIAPGTSCREAHFSPCPERRGGENGIAGGAPTMHGGRDAKGRAAVDFREET
jgi:hypothetical protein